jgi:hypothetical protein
MKGFDMAKGYSQIESPYKPRQQAHAEVNHFAAALQKLWAVLDPQLYAVMCRDSSQ